MQDQKGGDMDAQLENILDAYAASEPGPSRATLAEWIREYPQFARELTEFTAKWQLLQWVDEAPSADPAADAVADDDRLFLRAMSAAQSAFYTVRANREVAKVPEEIGATSPTAGASPAPPPRLAAPAPGKADAPITSLARAARQAGLQEDDVIDQVGLSDGLLRKLDRRLFDPATIPPRVLQDLANTIGRSVVAVVAYTRLPPAFGAGAQHRSDRAPSLPTQQEDFFEAVRKDLAIDESRRQVLLSLPRSEVSPGAHDGAGEA
jgi:hypothetical protein